MRTCHWFLISSIALVGAILFYWPQIPACMADGGAVAPALSRRDSVMLESRSVRGALVSVITVDLNDATVKVDVGLPKGGIPHAESFQRLMDRHTPLAAVTGTYFDVKTCWPTGSIVVGGKLVYESHIGTAVCFSPANRVRFIAAKCGEACDLTGAQCALRTGPRLLASGDYALNPRQEGFREHGLYGARTRMILGVTAANKLLLVSVRTPVTFSRAAGIMKALGAMDAVCLDGGTSSAMYYKGQVIRHPGRMLTNVIEVLRRPLSEIQAQLVASAAVAIAVANTYISRYRVHGGPALMEARQSEDMLADQSCEQVALLGEPLRLRPSKGLHSLFPIDRAKLSGLKRFDHS
jgi:hypothetical protein